MNEQRSGDVVRGRETGAPGGAGAHGQPGEGQARGRGAAPSGALGRAAAVAVLCLAGAASVVGACAAPQRTQPPQEAQLVRAISPPERLAPPEYLPASARSILRSRMASHAHDMGQLMSAIMLLRYPEIHERAQDIAHDARFARPLTGDASELNSALPERFFVLQEELRTRSGALADAAAKGDALAVADAYGRLSETCVRCHATYRQGPTTAAAAGEGP